MSRIRTRLFEVVARHPRTVLLTVLLVLLLVGGVGEVAAHNPAGHHVVGCDRGAEVVAQNNPNCHG